MIINILSGLRGHLVEFVADSPARVTEQARLDGYAIIRREDPVFKDSPYSTHALYTNPEGQQVAEAGHYDLNLEDARADLDRRTGRNQR
jgi:hypothetical protein